MLGRLGLVVKYALYQLGNELYPSFDKLDDATTGTDSDQAGYDHQESYDDSHTDPTIQDGIGYSYTAYVQHFGRSDMDGGAI